MYLLDTLISEVALNVFVYYIMISIKRTISNLADLIKDIKLSPPKKSPPKTGKPPRHPGNVKSKRVEGIAFKKGGKKTQRRKNKN
jgi:hypothetical protein